MGNSQIPLSLANISGKKIEADFDGGMTTSDGGVLLLRQAETRTGVVDRMVGAISDRRHQSYIDHTLTDLIRQRVFQIACGYEDGNDSNDLRSDPGLKTACERLPLTGDDLASQPTVCCVGEQCQPLGPLPNGTGLAGNLHRVLRHTAQEAHH